MILTVTLNPALDITYHVDTLTPGATHRVSRVDERLGGKGLNVASVLRQLGVPVVTTGLMRDPIPSFAPIDAAIRRTIVVTDGVDATGFWEPGPVVTPQEWAYFTAQFANLVADARVVVFSGSLPTGLPAHSYASLIGLARHAGCKTILDTSGPALAAGLTAHPDVVKPNAAELADYVRSAPTDATTTHRTTAHLRSADATTADRQTARPRSATTDATTTHRTTAHLRSAPTDAIGAGTIVESLGAQGLRARGLWARPPRVIAGNPTGAGDACVAALARGLLLDVPWPKLLRDAVALSAAAVPMPVAGQVDLDLYRELLPHIIVEEH